MEDSIIAERMVLKGSNGSSKSLFASKSSLKGTSIQNPAPADLKFVSWSNEHPEMKPEELTGYACTFGLFRVLILPISG